MNRQDESGASAAGASGNTIVDPILEMLQEEFDQIDLECRESGIDDADKRMAFQYARSMARRDREIAEVKAYALSQVAMLTRQQQGIEQWLGSKAAAAVARIIEHQKNKSYVTPWGKLGFRRQSKASVEFDAKRKADLIAWCKARCPDAISVTKPQPQEGILKEVLAAYMIETGEFCRDAKLVKPGSEVFYRRTIKTETEPGASTAGSDEVPFE